MPQPGMNGMEPAFGEAYGGHRGLLSPCTMAMSPQEGRTEYDQSILLMLGSSASPHKQRFELLSDLVDDGGLAEDRHAERWDVSALDEMTRYTKLGEDLLACSEEAVLIGRWGRSREEQKDEERRRGSGRTPSPDAQPPAVSVSTAAQKELCVTEEEERGEAETSEEAYQAGSEQRSEEHNYSLSQGGDARSAQSEEDSQTDQEEAELSSSSETECEEEAEPAAERPAKRRCFWEYRCTRQSAAIKKLGGNVHWSLSWSSSTLPSTLYRREGKKGRRKARKTDASDLTPNPQKLHSIGEQLQKLNAAIDGLDPVHTLPTVARARSRKEKNKLASRACRLKKKAQHEANKIKLWGLNQEYENLLGALLRIKEVIRRQVESSEEDDTDERGMTQRLEDILKESSGPLVAGRTKDFVQRILAASGSGQNQQMESPPAGEQAEG